MIKSTSSQADGAVRLSNHIVESGWFAVDIHNRLAYFHAGYGALPGRNHYWSGVAAEETGVPDLWETLVFPWMAKNISVADILKEGCPEAALFDSSENAKNSEESGTWMSETNDHLVYIPWDESEGDEVAARVQLLPGFVGFATPAMEGMWNKDNSGIPIYMFAYQEDLDHPVPGQYNRLIKPERAMPIPANIFEKIDQIQIDFSECQNLQIADHYGESEVLTYRNAPVRGRK